MNILNSIFKSPKITLAFLLLNLSYFYCNPSQFTVSAQTENLNPLESVEPDPLLPPKNIARPLTSLEKRLIQEKITILDNQAQLELVAGKKDEAFTLWYRELQLQRALGTIEEINALGRIGEIAWQQNLTQELNIISDRLITIEQNLTTTNTLNEQLLSSMGRAYQQVRHLDRAVIIYQQILQKSRKEDNFSEKKENLETLGKLYLAQFDYSQAANIYEELLKSLQAQTSRDFKSYVFNSKTQKDNLQAETYLIQLSEIYDKLAYTDKAIAVKQQLVENYLTNQKPEQIAVLKISLATDYQTLKQAEKAQKYYKEAFSLAWSLQQFSLAEDSLEKLALLYQNYQQPKAALEIYQELIKVHQKAYNYYNLMNTYSQIGEIYKQLSNYQQALNAYQKGLELARSLNHSVDHFQNKIEEIKSN
ncbi:MAG: tetratricopeptide repeat protein [Xenococcaceae cyanobacterium]